MEKLNIERYNQTDELIHKAAQIIAFLGKHLGSHKDDDSHTTCHYDADKIALVGKKISIQGKAYQVELRLRHFNIALVDTANAALIFSIKGRTIGVVIEEIKTLLQISDLPSFKLHYLLPATYHLDAYRIKPVERDARLDWVEARVLAAEVMQKVNGLIEPSSAINIWPHHFDTGTYHVLKSNSDGGAASIGCGFAMGDSVCVEPYFYIYGWMKDQEINYANAPELAFGEWKTGDWKGALLRLSDVWHLPRRMHEIEAFYQQSIHFLKAQIN